MATLTLNLMVCCVLGMTRPASQPTSQPTSVPASQPATRPATRAASKPLPRISPIAARRAIELHQVVEGMTSIQADAAMPGCAKTSRRSGSSMFVTYTENATTITNLPTTPQQDEAYRRRISRPDAVPGNQHILYGTRVVRRVTVWTDRGIVTAVTEWRP